VLLRDGRVLFIPSNATAIGIFDPTTNAYREIPGQWCPYAYWGGVLLTDGRVVFLPSHAKQIGVFDPKTHALSHIPRPRMQCIGAYTGGMLLRDGRVMFVPLGAEPIVFDPTTNECSEIPIVEEPEPYTGSVMLADGRAVLLPHVTNNIGIFDPTTNSLRAFPSGPGMSGTYRSGVLLPNGNVVLVPWDTENIGILTLSEEKARARARARALLRTEAVKEELIAAAWRPERMAEWCLDTDERRELADRWC
jgi:streptogramin lyase